MRSLYCHPLESREKRLATERKREECGENPEPEQEVLSDPCNDCIDRARRYHAEHEAQKNILKRKRIIEVQPAHDLAPGHKESESNSDGEPKSLKERVGRPKCKCHSQAKRHRGGK